MLQSNRALFRMTQDTSHWSVSTQILVLTKPWSTPQQVMIAHYYIDIIMHQRTDKSRFALPTPRSMG